jgi:hypothetical protein
MRRRFGYAREDTMPNYSLRLIGPEAHGLPLPLALLREVLDSLEESARRAVRLRLEGRSTARGTPPGWLDRACAIQVLGIRAGSTVIEFAVPTLVESVPDRLGELEREDDLAPGATCLTLLSEGLADATSGRADSDRFDRRLLETLSEWRRVLDRGITTIELGNERATVTRLDAEGADTIRQLEQRTPPPQRVRVSGRLDAIRHHDLLFTLVLDGGATLRGIADNVRPSDLARHWGAHVVVEGLAVFKPSGQVLRIEADLVEAAGADAAMWSQVPHAVWSDIPQDDLRRSQGPDSGINAIIGKWPGDETDDEIFEAIERLS